MKEISNSKLTSHHGCTPKNIKKAFLLRAKSKFFAHLFSINSKVELKEVVEFMENEYHKSVHICYGAIINDEEIFKNDSEVGAPGKVLLGILKNKEIKNQILIVARFYGGVKLGPSGVGRAFREAGVNCF